jgi:hypothetical protein
MGRIVGKLYLEITPFGCNNWFLHRLKLYTAININN